jgi:O-antigen ligase
MNAEFSLSKQNMFFWKIALVGLTLAITGLVCTVGITCNQLIAIVLSMVVLILWFNDKLTGAISGIFLYLTKSFWVRLAFALDIRISGELGFDLLGITPALLLAAITILELYSRLSGGDRICPDKSRKLLAAFIALNFLSVFNPSSSVIIGLAGLERNIIPNITMLYLLASVITERKHLVTLVKAFLVLGIISCAYAVGQYFAVLYPWEFDWFRQIALDDGLSGRMTIGLRGIEFRIFSIFYGYMDFFFTNVLIFAMALTHKDDLVGKWRKLRILYFVLWWVILALSIERMPLVMTLVVTIVVKYMKSSAGKRLKMIWRSALAIGVIYAILIIAGPALKSTGADKLIRLAELANPFAASSINDRAENKWGPALETIKGNPLGVGIGYGSQTVAKNEAAQSGLLVQPHNELIQKTLEAGYLGGLLYLLFFIALYKDFLKIGRTSDNKAFGYAMLSGTVAFGLCGMVNLPFCGASGLAYWSLAGAALAAKDRQYFGNIEGYQILNSADKNSSELMQNETCVNATTKADNDTHKMR